MPVFSLTRKQQEVFEALRWLYDPTDLHRRQGRTTVLVLMYIYRAAQSPNTWIEVEDHTGIRHMNEYVMQHIESTALRLGVGRQHIDFGRGRFRFTASYPHVLHAFERFGTEPDFLPVHASEFRTAKPRARRIDDPKTLWDHLKEED